ncbi:hypothetical protein ACOSP7_021056 [Xanthoceras sorbifolium]
MHIASPRFFLYIYCTGQISLTLEELENYKNESIRFGHQRAVQQVRQQVFQQVLKGARGSLNSSLNKELHLRTISDNIDTYSWLFSTLNVKIVG